jgi:hypothetical protein
MFRKNLHPRFQHRIMQPMIINNPPSHKPRPRCDAPRSEHERPTSLAKRIRHGPSRRRGLVLGEDREVVFPPCEPGVGVQGGEIRSEHRCGDFPTVRAVADKGVDQARGFQWLSYMAWRGVFHQYQQYEVDEIRDLNRLANGLDGSKVGGKHDSR